MWRELLCACLGTAWATSAMAASAEDLRNDWSGEYAPPRNLSITVAPLNLLEARQPMLDITGEIRTSETRSLAITSSMAVQGVGPLAGRDADQGQRQRRDAGQGQDAGTGQDAGIGQDVGQGQDAGSGEEPDIGIGAVPDPGQRGDRELGLQLRDYVVGDFANGLFLGGQVAFTNPDILRFRADRTRFGPMAGIKVSLSLFTVEGRAGAWLGMDEQGMSVEPRVDFATGFTF